MRDSPYKKKLIEAAAQKDKGKCSSAKKRKASALDQQVSPTEQNLNGLQCRKGKSKSASKIKAKPSSKAQKRKKSSQQAVDDTVCLYCKESFAESAWTQCQVCLQWAHDICADITPTQRNFVCDLCSESDS